MTGTNVFCVPGKWYQHAGWEHCRQWWPPWGTQGIPQIPEPNSGGAAVTRPLTVFTWTALLSWLRACECKIHVLVDRGLRQTEHVTYIIIATRVGWDWVLWFSSFKWVYCTRCWWQMDMERWWNGHWEQNRVPVLLTDHTGNSWGMQVGNNVKINYWIQVTELIQLMWKWENITDSSLSQLVITEINSVLVLLRCVVVGNVSNVLEVLAASIFRVKVCMYYIYTEIRQYTHRPWRWRKHIPPKHQQHRPQCSNTQTELTSVGKELPYIVCSHFVGWSTLIFHCPCTRNGSSPPS